MTLPLTDLIAYGLIVTLLVSLISKLRDMRGFVAILETTYGLSRRQAWPTSAATVAAEAGVLTLLAVQPTRGAGLGLAMALFAVFGATAAYAWANGRSGPCGCFGGFTGQGLGVRTVARAAALSAAALVGFQSNLAVAQLVSVEVSPAIALVGFTAAAVTVWSVRSAWHLRRAINQS